jgi:two-component system response regulator MprA
MTTILVVDDDRKITDMLRRTLAYEGYHVVTAADGNEALTKAQTQRPDLVVLDWLMPGLDGIEVARRIREADDTLILMLTARDAVQDRVTGLDNGADDYLVKPFTPAELLADLYLDPATRETRRGQRVFSLTPTEFDLLQYLMLHPRQVLPRERILQEVWGYDFGGNGNVLDVYIGYLRAKTEAEAESRLIQTVRGIGYALREES